MGDRIEWRVQQTLCWRDQAGGVDDESQESVWKVKLQETMVALP